MTEWRTRLYNVNSLKGELEKIIEWDINISPKDMVNGHLRLTESLGEEIIDYPLNVTKIYNSFLLLTDQKG